MNVCLPQSHLADAQNFYKYIFRNFSLMFKCDLKAYEYPNCKDLYQWFSTFCTAIHYIIPLWPNEPRL